MPCSSDQRANRQPARTARSVSHTSGEEDGAASAIPEPQRLGSCVTRPLGSQPCGEFDGNGGTALRGLVDGLRHTAFKTPLPSLFPGLILGVRSSPLMVPLAPPLVSPIAAIPLALLSAYVPHFVKSAIVATTIGCAPAFRARRTVWVHREPYA